MIAHLKGIVTEKASQLLTLDVNGVGYAVGVSDDRLYKKDQELFLYIYSHWNQDSGPWLYGFDTSLAKRVFAHILSCSGCGPKIGLAVLASFPAAQFLQIISSSDVRALSQVHGIGQKKAELMITQLKDKIAKFAAEDFQAAQSISFTTLKNVSAALAALHYKPVEITRALEALKQVPHLDSLPFDESLKKALAVLAKRV